jgi:hypothetical protein
MVFVGDADRSIEMAQNNKDGNSNNSGNAGGNNAGGNRAGQNTGARGAGAQGTPGRSDRNSADNLLHEERIRGGEHSAEMQDRDEQGQFAGRADGNTDVNDGEEATAGGQRRSNNPGNAEGQGSRSGTGSTGRTSGR